MTPFVIDANAIHAFQMERIRDQPGTAHDAIAAIFASHCLALDEERLCQQEWLSCAAGSFPFALLDWIADEMVRGRIRVFALADNSIRRQLTNLGMPTRDQKWVRLALGCNGKRIVTEDIDFFDPALKTASAARKAAAKAARSGACAKSLRKIFAVEVMCLQHVMTEAANAP